jgi:hypothetical protein
MQRGPSSSTAGRCRSRPSRRVRGKRFVGRGHSRDAREGESGGYLAVDVEIPTTSAIAEHFRMVRVSLLAVIGNPHKATHLAMAEHD